MNAVLKTEIPSPSKPPHRQEVLRPDQEPDSVSAVATVAAPLCKRNVRHDPRVLPDWRERAHRPAAKPGQTIAFRDGRAYRWWRATAMTARSC